MCGAKGVSRQHLSMLNPKNPKNLPCQGEWALQQAAAGAHLRVVHAGPGARARQQLPQHHTEGIDAARPAHAAVVQHLCAAPGAQASVLLLRMRDTQRISAVPCMQDATVWSCAPVSHAM